MPIMFKNPSCTFRKWSCHRKIFALEMEVHAHVHSQYSERENGENIFLLFNSLCMHVFGTKLWNSLHSKYFVFVFIHNRISHQPWIKNDMDKFKTVRIFSSVKLSPFYGILVYDAVFCVCRTLLRTALCPAAWWSLSWDMCTMILDRCIGII